MDGAIPDLAALAGLTDPLGVLTAYVDADPSRAAGPRPAWAIEIDDGLRELRADRRVAAALDPLQPRIADLVAPARGGRGRALVAPLSGGPAHEIAVQLPLETSVALGERPRLGPLLAALDAGRPTGLVTVSRDGIRMVHLRLGAAEEGPWLGFDADTGHWGQRVGTPGHAPTGAMPEQSGSAQHDRFDRALEEHQVHFVADAAADVVTAARRAGWRRLVVAGDPRLAAPLVDALPDAAGLEVVTIDGIYEWERPAQLAEALAPAIAEAQARRADALVAEAADRGAAGGRGARGRDDVAAALAEGRVETLLADADVDPDLLERAVAGSAQAVIVPPEALAPAGGVAAIPALVRRPPRSG